MRDREEAGGEGEDGVGTPGVCPGVAAGAGDGDAEASAAEGAVDYGGVAAAFEGDGGADAFGVGRGFGVEEVAHAAEVSFAFFANVGGEEDGAGWGDLGVGEGGGEGEESGEAGGVVAGSGGEDFLIVFLRGAVGDGGKDCVEVGGDEDDGRVWGGVGGGEFGEGVAFGVDVRVGEAEGGELLEEVLGSGLLGEGWGGDGDGFELPAAELGLVEMEPGERAVDGAVAGEGGDAEVVGGGHGCGSVETRAPKAGPGAPGFSL